MSFERMPPKSAMTRRGFLRALAGVPVAVVLSPEVAARHVPMDAEERSVAAHEAVMETGRELFNDVAEQIRNEGLMPASTDVALRTYQPFTDPSAPTLKRHTIHKYTFDIVEQLDDEKQIITTLSYDVPSDRLGKPNREALYDLLSLILSLYAAEQKNDL